ncbi:hypothetical protein F4776DRAFT_653032 [Hypoxylon sp. NC0597]|nr:hypothetical protein F4776DRAFT_653032 [Hypoxylon sp. NC0597]
MILHESPPYVYSDCQTGFYLVQEQYKPAVSYRLRLSDAEARRDCSKSHADLRMSRWRKLSQEKRQALLTEVAPDLEISPWINIRYGYMNERNLIHCRSLRRRRQLSAPWLNVNLLKTNPAILNALLHYRTAYPPQDRAAFDCRELTLGWACGFFGVDFCRKCVVRADILGFPRARLVLEAQAFILTTLRSIIDKILDGLTVNASFKRTGEVEFGSPYTNQAFSAPPLLDIDYLISLAKTRLDATGDHLWHLQCDPAYMRRHIKLQSRTSIFKFADKNNAAMHLAYEIYTEIFGHYWWHWVEMEYNIHPGHPLPPRYDRALGALELVLVNQVIYRAQILYETLTYCPGFSRYWELKRDADTPQDYFKLERIASNNTKEALEEDPLIEKARLDESLYKSLSDLSASREMLVAVRLSRPQNKSRNIHELIASEADRDRPAWKKMRLLSDGRAPPTPKGDLRRSGKALLEDFYSKPPSGQKKMEETIKKYFTGSTFTGKDDKILAEIKSNEIEPTFRQLSLDESGSKVKRELQIPREKIKSRPESSSLQLYARAATYHRTMAISM